MNEYNLLRDNPDKRDTMFFRESDVFGKGDELYILLGANEIGYMDTGVIQKGPPNNIHPIIQKINQYKDNRNQPESAQIEVSVEQQVIEKVYSKNRRTNRKLSQAQLDMLELAQEQSRNPTTEELVAEQMQKNKENKCSKLGTNI